METCASKKSTFVIAAAIAALAILIPLALYSQPSVDIEAVLSGLHRLEASYKPFPMPRRGPLVMVGFGGCTDLTVSALELMDALGVDPNATSTVEEKQSHDELVELNTLEDIIDEFTRMFISGAAAE